MAKRAVCGLLLAGTVAALLLQLWFFAHILWLRGHNPEQTALMATRREELARVDSGARIRHHWVDYRRIAAALKRAIVVAEDAKFVQHDGFDWEGIRTALERNQRRGRIVAGGSTITQQLAKNLFLSTGRSYARKVQEAAITVMLEAVLDKRRILELYLNVIEWGGGVFGCEAAARHYFAKSCAALSPVQAARLAAMVPNPRFYERNPEAAGLERRFAIILSRMPSAALP